MLTQHILQSRRVFLAGAASIAFIAGGTPVKAQKISTDETKEKLLLANGLFVLNEQLVAQAGMIKLGLRVAEARPQMEVSLGSMSEHLSVLRNGGGTMSLKKELSVAIQVALDQVDADWATYSAGIQAVTAGSEITDDQFWQIYDDKNVFAKAAQKLVATMYEVYGETVFSGEESRALQLLAKERLLCEEMREDVILTAIAAEPKKYHDMLAEAVSVFNQTLDVLARNHAMFGIAPPPSDEAVAALAKVEAHWLSTKDLIDGVIAKDRPESADLEEIWDLCDALGLEIDDTIKAYNAAMPKQ